MLEPCQGLVEPALLSEHVAQVVAGLEEAGLESHRLQEMGRCFVEFELVDQREAEIVVGLGVIRLESEHRSKLTTAWSSWPCCLSTMPRLL